MVTSLIISPISWRSPSVRVIGSNEVFEVFIFLCNPTCSLRRRCFSWVDIVYESTPSCSVPVSSLGKGNFYPSCSSFVAFCCSSTKFSTWALAIASYFMRFFTGSATHSFTSSFFHCMVDFFASTTEPTGVHHSGGQDSRTMKMTSLIAK